MNTSESSHCRDCGKPLEVDTTNQVCPRPCDASRLVGPVRSVTPEDVQTAITPVANAARSITTPRMRHYPSPPPELVQKLREIASADLYGNTSTISLFRIDELVEGYFEPNERTQNLIEMLSHSSQQARVQVLVEELHTWLRETAATAYECRE